MANGMEEIQIDAVEPQGTAEVTEELNMEDTGEDPPKIFEDLPEEVASIPVVQWVSVGKPPAVRQAPGEYYPELEPLEANLVELVDAGLDVYQTAGGDVVLYNPLFLGQEELKQAEAEGKLDLVAPTYGELTGKSPEVVDDETAERLSEYAKENVKKLRERGVSTESEGGPAVSGQPVPKLPAGAQEKIVSAQVKSGVMDSPTSGPAPGAGRILNSILASPGA